jgi:hypothetical protein
MNIVDLALKGDKEASDIMDAFIAAVQHHYPHERYVSLYGWKIEMFDEWVNLADFTNRAAFYAYCANACV